MRSRPRRSWQWTAALVGFALSLAAAWYASEVTRLAVAYKAKILCSGVFVAGRDPADVLSTDLALDNHWLIAWIPAAIDRVGQRARAGWANPWRGEAMFRPDLGCTLVHAGLPHRAVMVDRVPDRATLGAWPLPALESPRLEAVLDEAFREPAGNPARTRAIVVVHRDRLVGERYAPGFGPEMPLAGWSMAKSATNALIGVLVRQGRMALDEAAPVPEWRASGDARAAITIAHLLRMTSGLEFSETYRDLLEDVMRMLLAEADAAAFAAAKPLIHAPGSHWSYSGGSTNILSRVIRARVGAVGYDDFPRRALFDKLGMTTAVLEQDAAGNFLGSSFMYASARDWARLGLLYLHDGVVGTERILPEGWVAYSREPTAQSPAGEFGAHFWRRIPVSYRDAGRPVRVPADAFHAIGYEGQLLSIVPSRQLVVVRLGLTRSANAWRHDGFLAAVIKALDDPGGSAGG
ncbi:MAG: serine hydrolase [Methylotetracoccus sp.]